MVLRTAQVTLPGIPAARPRRDLSPTLGWVVIGQVAMGEVPPPSLSFTWLSFFKHSLSTAFFLLPIPRAFTPPSYPTEDTFRRLGRTCGPAQIAAPKHFESKIGQKNRTGGVQVHATFFLIPCPTTTTLGWRTEVTSRGHMGPKRSATIDGRAWAANLVCVQQIQRAVHKNTPEKWQCFTTYPHLPLLTLTPFFQGRSGQTLEYPNPKSVSLLFTVMQKYIYFAIFFSPKSAHILFYFILGRKRLVIFGHHLGGCRRTGTPWTPCRTLCTSYTPCVFQCQNIFEKKSKNSAWGIEKSIFNLYFFFSQVSSKDARCAPCRTLCVGIVVPK